MPTYEYACRDCGDHLEIVQSFKDEPLSVCGTCGGTLRKVFSPAGIIFKGSGFYVTDTRKEASSGSAKSDGADSSKKEAASSDGESTSSGDSSSDSGSDSKTTESSTSSSSDSGSESAA